MTESVERSGRSQDEVRELERIIARLHEEFANHDRVVIERAVHRHYGRFVDARVRDFVPILVERFVKQELRSTV